MPVSLLKSIYQYIVKAVVLSFSCSFTNALPSSKLGLCNNGKTYISCILIIDNYFISIVDTISIMV